MGAPGVGWKCIECTTAITDSKYEAAEKDEGQINDTAKPNNDCNESKAKYGPAETNTAPWIAELSLKGYHREQIEGDDCCACCRSILELFTAVVERSLLAGGKWLDDIVMNAAGKLLVQQFPHLAGFQDVTKLEYCEGFGLERYEAVGFLLREGIHWVCVSTVGSTKSQVTLFDSMYLDVSEDLHRPLAQMFVQPCNVLAHSREDPENRQERKRHAAAKRFSPLLVGNLMVHVVQPQRQKGSDDCGLFAIANATAVCFGVDPRSCRFDQNQMRQHLVLCLESGKMSMFPVVEAASTAGAS